MAKRKIFRYASFKSNRKNNPKPKKQRRNGSGLFRAGLGLIGLSIGLSALQSVQSN